MDNECYDYRQVELIHRQLWVATDILTSFSILDFHRYVMFRKNAVRITLTLQPVLSANGHYSTKYEHLEAMKNYHGEKSCKMKLYFQKFIPTVEHFVEFPWWGVFDEVRSYPHLRWKRFEV